MKRPAISAMLSASSPRAADWRRVFGELRAPLLCDQTVRARTPAGVGDYYLVDVPALSAEQRARAVAFIAERFGLSADEVREALDQEGLPLLADDVTAIVDLTQ